MNKDEALKIALEALETPSLSRGDPRLKAIQACKEALEQPAQEPVLLNVKTHDDKTYKVEVSAPSWQGLSDDEITECLNKTKWNDVDYCPDHDVFARHIEQALRDKNAIK